MLTVPRICSMDSARGSTHSVRPKLTDEGLAKFGELLSVHGVPSTAANDRELIECRYRVSRSTLYARRPHRPLRVHSQASVDISR
jgi:hypothetical protein